MNRALLTQLLLMATCLVLAACSSSKRAQTEATPTSGSTTWQSDKVKPEKKPLLKLKRAPSQAKLDDERRLAEKAARKAAAKQAKRAKEQDRLAQEVREKQELFTDLNGAPAREEAPPKVRTVLKAAESYLKTPYRFGGTTRQGIDCSGLLMVSFAEAGVKLPRTSAEQAKQGKAIAKPKVNKGDVIFFATGAAGRVSHAGLVVEATGERIRFIHASTSGGVRIDELSNPYWAPKYLWARRIID
jgi:cell wall-associated NlpC family hydrolase